MCTTVPSSVVTSSDRNHPDRVLRSAGIERRLVDRRRHSRRRSACRPPRRPSVPARTPPSADPDINRSPSFATTTIFDVRADRAGQLGRHVHALVVPGSSHSPVSSLNRDRHRRVLRSRMCRVHPRSWLESGVLARSVRHTLSHGRSALVPIFRKPTYAHPCREVRRLVVRASKSPARLPGPYLHSCARVRSTDYAAGLV